MLLCAPKNTRREQQRAALLELKIAEMTDRERDFEKIKAELMNRIAAGNAHAEELQRQNDRVSCCLVFSFFFFFVRSESC
jgi:hypothetical protein